MNLYDIEYKQYNKTPPTISITFLPIPLHCSRRSGRTPSWGDIMIFGRFLDFGSRVLEVLSQRSGTFADVSCFSYPAKF